MLGTISSLPITGKTLLAITTGLFLISASLGWLVRHKTRDLMQRLASSVRNGEDYFIDTSGIIQEIRASYRRKVGQLESIDTATLVQVHLNRWTILKLANKKVAFQQVTSFLSGSPSYLVTLGLIGTFLGLIENLSELSELVSISNSSEVSGLLRSMGTAFTVSFFGVTFSLALWILEHIMGIDTIEDRLVAQVTAYLDGIVQTDVKRASPVGEAVERIESYLADFLTNFTECVRIAIEKAMRDKLDEVFDSVEKLSSMSNNVMVLMERGAQRYEASSTLFKNSATLLTRQNNVQATIAAAEKLSQSNQMFADNASKLANSARAMKDMMIDLNESWATKTQCITDVLSQHEKSLAAANQIAEGITKASAMLINSLESIQQSMPSLDESIRTGNEARSDARILMEKMKVAIELLTTASWSAADATNKLSSGSETLSTSIKELMEATNELKKSKRGFFF